MDSLNFIIEKFKHSGIISCEDYEILPISRNVGFPELLRELGMRKGAEVGVGAGEFSEVLLRLVPGLALYCVDIWQRYQGYREKTMPQKRHNELYKKACARLEPLGAEILRMESRAGALQFADHSLDFVYIDANHDFYHVVEDLQCWVPKVRKGGIISGHDYKKDSGIDWDIHVKYAVDGWVRSFGIEPLFVFDHLDDAPGWMWVKQ